MRLRLILSLLLLLSTQALTWAQEAITLEDIWNKRTFTPSYVSGFNFLNDGQHYTKQIYSREKSMHQIVKYDLKTGEEVAIVFNGDALKAANPKSDGRFAGYTFSEDEQKLLIETDVESIYRHSYKAMYYVVDLSAPDAAPVALSDGGKQQLAAFSPAGDKVGFVRDNNLYYKDLATGQEHQLTTDGQKNSIINGLCDWVYEEEFGQDRAFCWSPDGQKIAFLRFDESAVREFTMPMYYNDAYPEPYTFKYPKAGETNATVTVHTYNLATGATQRMKTGDETDIYFPRIKWTQDANTLCITRLNRHQNHLELLLADATTGATRTLLEERNEYYVDIHDAFVYQTVAANLRGFRSNIRNGSNYALFNAELRIPITKYLTPHTIENNFLRNLQLVGFFDAGTAWEGFSPFRDDNPLNTVVIQNDNSPVRVTVNYFRNPIVMGYGLGARSTLLGYYVRADYGWGVETGIVNDPILYLSIGTDF